MSSRQNEPQRNWTTRAITEDEYEDLKQSVDYYISRIRANERNQVLKDESIAEFERFLDRFHTRTWSFKKMFYALMKKKMASRADASLREMWGRYVVQSASLEEQRQQQMRDRSEQPAQLLPPRYNSLYERDDSLIAPNAGHPQGPGGGPHLVPGLVFLGPSTPGFTGPYGPGHGQAVVAYPTASMEPAGPVYHNNRQAILYPTNPSNPTGPRHQGPPPDVVHVGYHLPTRYAYPHRGGAGYQYSEN